MLTIVQSTNYSSGEDISNSGAIVFSSTPTQGNLLVVGMSYAGPKHPSGAPVGWTQIDDLENGTSNWLTTYQHVVGASETNSYAFTTTGGDFLSVVAFEITGQATSSFINQHAIANVADTDVSNTPSVTPSVSGCLAIAFVSYNDGTSASSTPATVGSGWTMDQHPLPLYHSCVCTSKNALTTDTSTPISAAVTWAYEYDTVASTILIAPAVAAGANTGNFFSIL